MKALTMTAVVASLVAIPLILHKCIRNAGAHTGARRDDPRRYDLFDFVS
jgi:hypothetical protein